MAECRFEATDGKEQTFACEIVEGKQPMTRLEAVLKTLSDSSPRDRAKTETGSADMAVVNAIFQGEP
jgi:hypothetical protein